MFYPDRSTYTGPIKTPEALAGCLGENSNLAIPPTNHNVTIKTCDAPDLLGRALISLTDKVHLDYVTPHVVDDSRLEDSRSKNRAIARRFDARYGSVIGPNSIVTDFARFINETESPADAKDLGDYLERITTDFPRTLHPEERGGVAGAHNVGTLMSVMSFGELKAEADQWLTTFLDDDVVMPPNAEAIFRLIGMYHKLGNIGIVVSNYLHHTGSPMALASGVLRHFERHADTMTDAAIDKEIRNLLRRTPTVGLRNSRASDGNYSRPEVTMTFPAGNYTLSGRKGYDIPVPIVGVDDLGYGELLRAFIGAATLGVARVPDFLHLRRARIVNNGEANGSLEEFCSKPAKDIIHEILSSTIQEFAKSVEGVPEANLKDLQGYRGRRRNEQLRQLRNAFTAVGALQRNKNLTRHADVLEALKKGFYEQLKVRRGEYSEDSIDRGFLMELIASMRSLHPQLVDKAYQYGAAGRFREYSQKITNSTPQGGVI